LENPALLNPLFLLRKAFKAKSIILAPKVNILNKLQVSRGILFTMLALIATSTIPHINAAAYHTSQTNTMWIDPADQTFVPSNASIGYKFNITVSLSITTSDNVFGYQVALLYNRTLLAATKGGFTAGSTSNYFTGHDVQTAGPTIDTSSLGNGSVLIFESCKGDDFIASPKTASLVWIEFQLLVDPSIDGTITTTFDITTQSPNKNWVQDYNLVKITLTPTDGNLTITVPEYSQLLMILPLLTAVAFVTVATKRKTFKNISHK
jgi:hypothetical protein